MPAVRKTRNKRAISTRWRRSKIIATVGPATDNTKAIKELIKAGVNVFRLNMSHGDHKYHRMIFNRIRRCAKQLKSHTAILMDLCGPKIRVGKFENDSIQLVRNTRVIIRCANGIGSDGLIISSYRQLYKDVNKGDRIFLDDGNIECRVESIEGKDVRCKVTYGGELKNNKGLNLPDSRVSASSLTDKDKLDVQLAMELQADFIALSFVRSSRDIENLKRFMRRTDHELPVIAKIERPEAVTNIDHIIDSSYGIMIARGDLGIELPVEEVPLIQKNIINKARLQHRPVIVATQMMESMITCARPTRAEVGDVANAALTSADAVMLSAETAVGKYPLNTVRMMDKILREIEQHQAHTGSYGDAMDFNAEKPSSRNAVAHAANTLAYELKLQGIIIPTDAGHTASVLSACRPASPLIGASPNRMTCQKLSLHWGIIPYFVEQETCSWRTLSEEIGKRCKLTKAGSKVLLVSGFNSDTFLNEPVLKIIKTKT